MSPWPSRGHRISTRRRYARFSRTPGDDATDQQGSEHGSLHGATPGMALGICESFWPLDRLLP